MTNEELEQIIQEELEAVVNEKKGSKRQRKKKAKKKDACYRKVKARYKVWPSAYGSGALVQCRKKGAKNWGNKSKKKKKKNEETIKEEFKSHEMFDPKTGGRYVAKTEQEHLDMAAKGYTHVDPNEIRKIIGKGEGGAAGLTPFLEKFGKDMEEEIIKTLQAMPDIGQHENGDYVMADDKEVDIVKERKKNCGCGQDPCKTYGKQ